MARTKISEFSATPGNNTDIDGINLAEGCAPSGINDAIRELMSQLKDFQAGTAGDSFNGPVGTTTASAGAFTTLSASSSVTLSGGTANGVPYLNGSKVLTTGSALTFDGANLGVSGNATLGWTGKLSFSYDTIGSYTKGLNSLSRGLEVFNYENDANGGIRFMLGTTASPAEAMRLTSTGLGIGTSAPSERLDVYLNSTGNISAKVGNTTGSVQLLQSNGIAYLYTAANQPIAFSTNNTERMRLDSSGNLGLGVTPSAWRSGARAFQLGATGYASLNEQANGSTSLNFNCFESAANTWTYFVTGVAPTRYTQLSGAHQWFTAPSGTAGNAISFTQAMTLDASGNLGVGITSPGNYAKTAVVGSVGSNTFYAGSSTQGVYIFNSTGTDVVYNSSGNSGGSHVWQTGNTERARITSDGNFIQSAPTTPPSLGTNGTMVFNLTSNTNLRISVRGSDGVTRTANITLA